RGRRIAMVMHGYAHDDEVIGKAYDSRLVKRFLPYMRPYGWRVILAVVLLLGTTVLILAQPVLIQQAIDRDIRHGTTSDLSWITSLYVVTLVLMFAFTYVQSVLMVVVGLPLMNELRL